MSRIVHILSFFVLLLPWHSNAQIISTVAGIDLNPFYEGIDATATKLKIPWAIAVDAAGNIYYTDLEGNVVRKIDVNGKLRTVAGIVGYVGGYSGDGGPATNALLNSPFGITLDNLGNLYIADTKNNAIRKVNTSGIISTYASGISEPFDLVCSKTGEIYVSTVAGNAVVKIATSGSISTIVSGFGTAVPTGFHDLLEISNARLSGIALDTSDNLYIADHWENVIRKVTPTGSVVTICGSGGINWGTYCGDGGPAVDARLDGPRRICTNTKGNISFSDTRNFAIRCIDANGIIRTIAGGSEGWTGDGGPATNAKLSWPAGVAYDKLGNLYIADTHNGAIRKVSFEKAEIAQLDAATDDISISPNPGNGELTMQGKWGKDKQITVEIIDATGKLIHESRIQINEGYMNIKIRTETKASGTYLLRLSSTNRVMTRPFVIAQ